MDLINLVAMPVYLQWLVGIVLFDCWQYWWHRINHRMPFLWRFHAVHHSDVEMDASSGVRFHTVEIILSLLAHMVVLPLLGLTVTQLLVYEALSLPIILFHHANLRVPAGVDRRFCWVIVTPWIHYVHHSRWRPETTRITRAFCRYGIDCSAPSACAKNRRRSAWGSTTGKRRGWRPLPGMLTASFRKPPSRGGQNSSSKRRSATLGGSPAKELKTLY